MLSIRYATADVVAFTIHADLYYLVLIETPCILDAKLNQLQIPNIDIWLQANTAHRYSLTSIRDMAEAFRRGAASAYTYADVLEVCGRTVKQVRELLFVGGAIADYANHFWIEILNQVRISKVCTSIRDRFQEIRLKVGDEVLYNDLCRLWKLCRMRWPNDAAVLERLIKRLGRQPDDPKYPITTTLDEELTKQASHLVSRHYRKLKGVPDEVVNTVHDIQTRRLQRS